MARDAAYFKAEKKIEEALKSGTTELDPSPVSPNGEKPKVV